jgi:hypothetical protein
MIGASAFATMVPLPKLGEPPPARYGLGVVDVGLDGANEWGREMEGHEESTPSVPRWPTSVSVVAALLAVVAILTVWTSLARSYPSGLARAAVETDATSTRRAELEELDSLRTQVAQSTVCVLGTPVATAMSTPTVLPTEVPPAAMGKALPYTGDWTVTVSGFVAAPQVDATGSGRYVQVSVTVTNNVADTRTFPFRDLILADASGRIFLLADDVTTQLYGPSWYLGVPPSLETPFRLVYEVAADAGTAFILESKSDPTFRVAVQLQVLG